MKILLAALAAAMIPGGAFASTLAGDDVSLTISGPGVLYIADFPAVAGVDESEGVFQFDVDAGAGGDLFAWTSIGNIAGQLAGANSMTLSDLDFSDGWTLTGFDVIQTLLSGVTVSTTSHSVTVNWTSPTDVVGPGTVIVGQFLTEPPIQGPGGPATVPLPASAPLAMAGFAALLALGRRRRRG